MLLDLNSFKDVNYVFFQLSYAAKRYFLRKYEAPTFKNKCQVSRLRNVLMAIRLKYLSLTTLIGIIDSKVKDYIKL
jgi:hypothetical protein